MLRESGKDASRLDRYTWHGNRHTFGSRLAMAGVPDRTIQELSGWKTLKMVQRYSHLSAAYLHEDVARLVESGMARRALWNFVETSTTTLVGGTVYRNYLTRL